MHTVLRRLRGRPSTPLPDQALYVRKLAKRPGARHGRGSHPMVSPSPLLRPGRRQSDQHTHGMWRMVQWLKLLCNFLSVCGLLVHNGSSQRHPLPTTSDASKLQLDPETIIPRKEPTSSPPSAIHTSTTHSYPTRCPTTELVMRHHRNAHHTAPPFRK